jgi:hypothetical protein
MNRQFTHLMQVAHEFSAGFLFSGVEDQQRDDASQKEGMEKLCVSLIKMYLAQKALHCMRERKDLCGTQIDHNLCNVLHACTRCIECTYITIYTKMT